jgi:ribulose-phosphate 3-epimerase
VDNDTVASVVKSGAEMLVAGSAVFQKGRTEKNARELLRRARAAEPVSESAKTTPAKAKPRRK